MSLTWGVVVPNIRKRGPRGASWTEASAALGFLAFQGTPMRASIAKLVLAASALVLASASAQAQEEKVLNVYNWSDYIAEDTLKRFTEETGIKVNYDVYDSNEALEAKLMAGKSGYDVVFPSVSPFLANQIKAGIYQPLDKAKIPNLANVKATTLKAMDGSDPGNKFGVPYMTAPTAIGINVDKVKKLLPDAPLDSWRILLDPAVTQKLQACGLTLLDDPNETFPAALAYLGKNPTSQSKEDMDAATDVLSKVRSHLKYIHSSKYINDLANGDICVAHGYGGDLIQARERAKEAKKKANIIVIVPKEGAQAVTDAMAIPKDAPHPENAHKFINFILKPDVIGPISSMVGYANSVNGAEKFTDEAVLKDPAIFPPAEVQSKLFVAPPAEAAYLKARTRAWNKIKTKH